MPNFKLESTHAIKWLKLFSQMGGRLAGRISDPEKTLSIPKTIMQLLKGANTTKMVRVSRGIIIIIIIIDLFKVGFLYKIAQIAAN